jgi:hypothetical protein
VAFVKADNKFNFEEEEQDLVFNPAAPIVSFRKMINYNKEDLVDKALKGMDNYITSKLAFTVTEEAYKQMCDCAGELRTACVSQQE